jgi:hypothetical protein
LRERGSRLAAEAALRLIVNIKIAERWQFASRTMNDSACSSIIQGGGKRRGASRSDDSTAGQRQKQQPTTQ